MVNNRTRCVLTLSLNWQHWGLGLQLVHLIVNLQVGEFEWRGDRNAVKSSPPSLSDDAGLSSHVWKVPQSSWISSELLALFGTSWAFWTSGVACLCWWRGLRKAVKSSSLSDVGSNSGLGDDSFNQSTSTSSSTNDFTACSTCWLQLSLPAQQQRLT